MITAVVEGTVVEVSQVVAVGNGEVNVWLVVAEDKGMMQNWHTALACVARGFLMEERDGMWLTHLPRVRMTRQELSRTIPGAKVAITQEGKALRSSLKLSSFPESHWGMNSAPTGLCCGASVN